MYKYVKNKQQQNKQKTKQNKKQNTNALLPLSMIFENQLSLQNVQLWKA